MKDYDPQEFLNYQRSRAPKRGPIVACILPGDEAPAGSRSPGGGHLLSFGRISSTVGHRPERDVRNGAGVPLILDVLAVAGIVSLMIAVLVTAWRTI